MTTTTLADTAVLRGDPEAKYKSLVAKVAPSVDPDSAVDVACFMSTDSVDADDEVLLPEGCDLSRFDRNPVVLLCHAYGQPGCYYPLPVGKVEWTKKRPRGLLAGVRFTDKTPMGREVKALFDDDMLRSFSVGFRPIEASPMTREEADSRPDWRAAFERTKGRLLVHRKWHLLELSVAPVPSNPDALTTSYKAKGLTVPAWLALPSPTRKAPSMATATDASATATEQPTATETSAKALEGLPPLPPANAGVVVKCMGGGHLAIGDHVRHVKSGMCGRIKSLDTSGYFPRDDSEYHKGGIEATETQPVARIHQCDGEHERTGKTLALYAHHLAVIPDGDGDEDDDVATKAAKPRGDAAAGTETATEEAAEDQAEQEDGEAAVAGKIKKGVHVDVKAPHYKGVGVVTGVYKRGHVPDVPADETVRGTPEEPAARVKLYVKSGDGHLPTDDHTAAKVAHLSIRGEELKAPTKPKAAPAPRGKATAGLPDLPPLVPLSEAEVVASAVTKLDELLRPESIRKMVATELDRRMGYV